MDRPVKRMKLSPSQHKSSPSSGSRLAEGLFTSELGVQSPSSDHNLAVPTRTIDLLDFQRRIISRDGPRLPRPILPRRNAGINLIPRAPDVTVTANVVEININDGTGISVAVVPVSTGATAISLPLVGSVTLPGVSISIGLGDAVDDAEVDADSDIITSGIAPIITKPPSLLGPALSSSSIGPLITSAVTTELSPAASVFLEALNSTSALSSEQTLTTTATSTFSISLVNGTVVTPGASTSSETTLISSTQGLNSTLTSANLTSTTISASRTASRTVSGSLSTHSTSLFSDASATTVPNAGSDATAAVGSTATSPGAAASSSSSPGSGSGNEGPTVLTPAQQQVVGGVVGGVAGIAIVLLILLVILRWYRRRLKARGELPEQMSQRHLTSAASSHLPVSQRSSITPLVSVVANSLKKFRPGSSASTYGTRSTSRADSTTPEPDRSFQRIAGRKIAPVLGGDGDGYGGNYGAFERENVMRSTSPLARQDRGLAGVSFYRDYDGFYGGKGSGPPTFSSSFAAMERANAGQEIGPSLTRDFATDHLSYPPSQMPSSAGKSEGVAVLRHSPARTPITVSPAASSLHLPSRESPTLGHNVPPLPTGPTGLTVPSTRERIGRSLTSQDGSVTSGRSISTGRSRFAENID